jgi:glycosyltransferase involved in cell wall biosynthesis
MKLGFYYHVNVFLNNGKIYTPEYFGVFIDELAKNVDQLIYFVYSEKKQPKEFSYEIKSKNIELIDLGNKKSFPKLVLFGYFDLLKYKNKIISLDAFLVRAPSPLAPHFYFAFNRYVKMSYLMVGDYLKIMKLQAEPFYRKPFVLLFGYINDIQQKIAIRRSSCVVNSFELKEKYKRINNAIIEVKTSTITETDFYFREDAGLNGKIKLLFVGNIHRTKGVEDLIEVFHDLYENGYNMELNVVGWETDQALSYVKTIQDRGMANHFVYHGFKSGQELMSIYRASDIFVLPSYHEGFPRVIWEAMANSLPVISTNVGSIPFYLKNGHDAILIEAGDKKALYDSIVELIENTALRKKIIDNSYKLVSDYTLDKQVKILVDHLNL